MLADRNHKEMYSHSYKHKNICLLVPPFVGVEVQNSFKDKNLQARMNVLEVSEQNHLNTALTIWLWFEMQL